MTTMLETLRRLSGETTERISQLDGLTGLWNRAYLDDRLEAETASAIRYGNSLSLVLCDLDRFKSLNDSYGHPFGDEVLERTAGILGSGRSPDVACRYGGEEFALIAPGTDLMETMEVADRHRVRISEIQWTDRPGVRISASFGVADLSCISGAPTPEKLIAAADQALYRAKKAGRNQVVAADAQVWPHSATG